MGGKIFVGVRTASGAEHIGVSWTNWLPLQFARPDTYEGEGGQFVKELCEYWDNRESGGFKERTTRIKNVEYGVVLLDIPSCEIWEQNAYFTPLHWNYGSGDSREYSQLLLELLAKKQYSNLELYRVGRERMPRVGPPTPEEMDVIERMARRHVAGGESGRGPEEVMGLLNVVLPWAKLVHEHKGGGSGYLTSQADWDEMRAWAKARGWKAPINKTPRR